MLERTLENFDFFDFAVKSFIVVTVGIIVLRIAPRRWSAARRFSAILATLFVFYCSFALELSSVLGYLNPYTWSERHGLPLQTMTVTISDSATAWLGRCPTIWLVGTVCCVGYGMLRFVCGELTCLAHFKPSPLTLGERFKQADSIEKRVVVTSACTSPNTRGIFLPRIFLPLDYLDWPESDLNSVLSHELEHIRRRDLLWLQLGFLCTAVLWFVPTAWRLYRCLRLEQEKSCDDAVLRSGVNARTYCETLVRIGCERNHGLSPGASLSLCPDTEHESWLGWFTRAPWLTGPSSMHQRIVAAIDPKISHAEISVTQAIVTGILAVVVAVALASVRIRAVSPSQVIERRIELAITNTNDDAEEDVEGGYVCLDSTDLEFTYERRHARQQLIGIRVCSVCIPRNSKLLEARFEFNVESYPREPLAVRIEGQLIGDAAAFTRRKFNISSRRSDRNPSCDWLIPSISLQRENQLLKSCDLSSVIQTIVDQPDWHKGNAMVFLFSDGDEVLGEDRCKVTSADDYHGHSPPTLVIRYFGRSD